MDCTGVYAITCTATGKQYVGSTSRSFDARWAIHRCRLRQGRHHSRYLQNAWDKHGADSFTFSVLEICAPDDCIAREQAWMDKLRPVFNVHPNARSALGVKRPSRPQTPETRAKISAGNSGKKRTPEQCERVRAAALTRVLATHCRAGHAYDEANTYISKTGRRDCRACHRDREKRDRARGLRHRVSRSTVPLSALLA